LHLLSSYITYLSELPTKPLSDLLMSLCPKLDPTHTAQLSFSQLRDQLLDLGPLNLDHIKKVNKAEAEFWKASEGERLGDSTDILGFDCGGEQLVMEFCFPIGTLQQLEGAPSSTCVTEGKDLAFVQRLLALIEAAGIPAPSPIEQRWTASSSAYMSPAYAASEADQQIFSWVGVIMYLPPNQTEEQRQSITTQFRSYLEVIQPLLEEYDAHAHWAKIEVPTSSTLPAAAASDDDKNSWFGFLSGAGPATPLSADSKIATLRSRLASRYPVKDFNKYREALDPHSILSNTIVDTLISNKVDSQ
jgi:L-galactono-1,4-lactone dehydrogenase